MADWEITDNDWDQEPSSGSKTMFLNYWDSKKPSYRHEVTGQIVKFAMKHRAKWNPSAQKFDGFEYWDDGNPKKMMQVHIITDEGERIIWEFAPKSIGRTVLTEAAKKYFGRSFKFNEINGHRIHLLASGADLTGMDIKSSAKDIQLIVTLGDTGNLPLEPYEAFKLCNGQSEEMTDEQKSSVAEDLSKMPPEVAKSLSSAMAAQDYQPPIAMYDQDVPF